MKNVPLLKLLVLFLLIFYLGIGCKKKEAPVLETMPVINVLGTTAISGGKIIDDGDETIISRGVCWSKELKPSVSNDKTLDGAGAGTFVSNMSDLDPASTYYVRAYATNANGIGYGMTMSFATLGQIPVVGTITTSHITTTSVNLVSRINPNYLSTSVFFEYGPTINYGNSLAANQSPITGYIDVTVSGTLSGLSPGTNYHCRVKAENSLGITYGSDKTFLTSEANPVTDVDGNVYSVVEIGTQIWIAENLKTTRYNDNSGIPLITSNTDWAALTTPGYCWYNNDETANKPLYGALYNWYTVNTGKLCPIGWHVPTNDDFTILTEFLGGTAIAGGKMKEAGLAHWTTPNTGATNESGFTALPAGIRNDLGVFTGINLNTHWWSATQYNIYKPYYRSIGHNNSVAFVGYGSLNQHGFTIRCVKD